MAETDESRHVFVSYVREDKEKVDQLCSLLEAAQIPYWRDLTSLEPGDAWKMKIRQAIRDGSLVFLACFSGSSRARLKSHMNEELTVAVEEYRAMPPGRTWLIPIRFDEGDLPEWDLGAGRMLDDLNRVDLFGDKHSAQSVALVTKILRLMGEKQPNLATALAAIEQTTDADRGPLLKRLTKDMLLEPARRIELEDLISQEVRHVVAAMNDDQRFPDSVSGDTTDEIVIELIGRALKYWALVEPFCYSLQVAARFGGPDQLAPWVSGMKAFSAVATKVKGGNQAALALRALPVVSVMMTAGVACTASGKWGNLRALVVESTVRQLHTDVPAPVITVFDPFAPFTEDLVPNTLARTATVGEEPVEALQTITAKKAGKYHMPVAEWLHRILRPLFEDQLADDDAYDDEFDRAEVMLGLLSQDSHSVQAHSEQWQSPSRWYGRSTWRTRHSRSNPVMEFRHELQSMSSSWGPLRQDLFGGDPQRAERAIDGYEETFKRVADRSF